MLSYTHPEPEWKNWIFRETAFDPRTTGKCESVMCLGNGYLGLRSAAEEHYLGEKRNLFIAGTFNRFDEHEVPELPNCADTTGIELEMNGVCFRIDRKKVTEYCRQLNLKTGELTRSLIYDTPATGRVRVVFRRFVSMADLHLIGQRLELQPLDMELRVRLVSGIDAQMANSGVQHFSEGTKRLYENKVMQLVQTTTQSKIDVVHNLVHSFSSAGREHPASSLIGMERRRIFMTYEFSISKDAAVTVEKLATVHTSRDREFLETPCSLETLQETSWKQLLGDSAAGYEALFQESAAAWDKKVWSVSDIEIDSRNEQDQLAIRFAVYHLNSMTPRHDNRMNIGAKGLSGEGYKGHTFWDTEIFMLPYFSWTMPEVARSLLEYRYLSLPGAHRKAAANGYRGAMFPWESAWLDDGETTPVWGAADIVTGEATKIWTGFIAQHISSDVAFGVWQYYMITGDEDFMDRYGYELMLDTARFWASRLEWNKKRGMYYINDVVGPDEYKEHVNNNAYTNFTAHWTIVKALEFCERLKYRKPARYAELDRKLGLAQAVEVWRKQVDRIYLPKPDEDGLLPQDDTYLVKKDIDLSRYKKQKHVGELFKDFNMHQVNEIQVSKQADVLLLLYLFENFFPEDTKRACWKYYEPRTLHDSSLSLSTHSVLASDMGEKELAYLLFRRAADIDLGPDMKSSDHGIHAAALGGVWQCVVCGFGGVRMLDGRLRINPHLPDKWSRLKFPIRWKGDLLEVEVSRKKVRITRTARVQPYVEVQVRGSIYRFEDVLELTLRLPEEREEG